MNVICPNCEHSYLFHEGSSQITCDGCGFTTNVSALGTAPGNASAPLLQDLSGTALGEYQIEELIGVGGMGVVYRGRRAGDEVPVAIKLLSQTDKAMRAEFVARFKREISALTRLNHPNIVKILDSGEQGDTYYLVTEYVPGLNLSAYLKAHSLEAQAVFDILGQVASAISYAHENGIVHRDIKPANIVMAGGVPKVLDFGLAQIATAQTNATTLTRTDLAMGTFNYLSPEQRKGAKNVDPRTDVFSLGVVLFEMLTGELPLGSFQPPSKMRGDVGRDCDRVVLKSLSPNPQDRFPDASDFQRAIVKLKKGGRSVSKILAAAVLVAVAAFALGAFVLFPSPPVSLSDKSVPFRDDVPESAIYPRSVSDKSPSAAPAIEQVAGPSNPDSQVTLGNIDPAASNAIEAKQDKSPAPAETTKRKPKPQGTAGSKKLSEKKRAALSDKKKSSMDKKKGRSVKTKSPPAKTPFNVSSSELKRSKKGNPKVQQKEDTLFQQTKGKK